MAWRFKASKYKNAAPIVPKPESCVRDICVGSYQTYGNNIAASAAFMAFNWEHTGSSLAILPIDDCGRKSKTMPLLHAHSDTVTDAQFSPFHDGMLATSSQDCLVKIWHIPEQGLEQSITDPECTFSHKQRRVETVGFHPTADCLLHSTAAGCISLFDLTLQKEILSNNEHPDVIQSVGWKQDGSVLATSCKDKIVRIIDPRSKSIIQLSADSHQSIKDSRVFWLGEQNRILTTGFDAARVRQIMIRDTRMFSQPEKILELDCSTGILMPLFDPDTNMLFLVGKGDTTINYMEVTDKDPYLIEGLRHTGEQTKGACLIPKRALKVMEGEVNRVLQLTSNMVIPIMYQVPRKTYRDFHSDLYPDTNYYKTDLIAGQWMSGVNIPLSKMSLDPIKRELGDVPITIHRGNLKELIKNIENNKLSQKTQNGNNNKSAVTKFERVLCDGRENQNHNSHSNNIKNDNGHSDNDETFKPLSKIDLIKKFDDKYKTDSEKETIIHKITTTTRTTPSGENDESSPENDSNTSSSGSTSWNQNKSENVSLTTTMTPPKPLPRTSRNNSITTVIESIGVITNQDNFDSPRPVARPRTVASTYKPRLGPKPFSSNSSDVSFDKVFSVPHVPGAPNAQSTDIDSTVTENNLNERKPAVVEIQIKKEDSKRIDTADKNGSDPSGKSLTTSERRKSAEEESSEKVFELNYSESSGNSTESEDKPDDLKRLSSNRCSIAERRRLYEARSKSVQEEKPQSPILRREQTARPDGDSTPRHSVTDGKFSDLNKCAPSNKKVNETAFTKRTSTVFGKVSKFRHLKGTPGHKSTQIDNLRNLSRQIPGECNGFHANHERVAVPLSGPGGKVAIFELSKPGRLPDGVIPSLVNGSNIMDFQWDPFDTNRIAVACDDGIVRFWRIPRDGLIEPTNEPEKELIAHLDKIYFIRFHPCAENVFLTASYDMTIKLWDLNTLEEKYNLKGHTDQIFDFSWSPCGVYGATVCKDGKLRIYNARKSELPIKEGNGPVGTRGARLTYAIEGQYIVVTGFDKVSERQISLYHAQNLQAPLGTVSLDVSPAILIPFYDEDSSTLFVTGKGDSTIYCYEITDEEPYICALSHHRCSTLHQGLSFLTKNHCDVASVEFSKAYRLTNTTIEPLSFTVPRLKTELFQDDLFPPTRVTWTPTLTSNEWFTLSDKIVKKSNLQPEGMSCLSSIQSNVPIAKKIDPPTNSSQFITQSEFDKSRQQKIQKSVSARMEYNTKLEQDEMEGVDEVEWEE